MSLYGEHLQVPPACMSHHHSGCSYAACKPAVSGYGTNTSGLFDCPTQPYLQSYVRQAQNGKPGA